MWVVFDCWIGHVVVLEELSTLVLRTKQSVIFVQRPFLGPRIYLVHFVYVVNLDYPNLNGLNWDDQNESSLLQYSWMCGFKTRCIKNKVLSFRGPFNVLRNTWAS